MKKNKIELKALSIAQPWVECILRKGKNIENRSWNTKYRGYFAIHASAANNKERFSYCKEDYGINIDPEELPFGAIVGFAELVEVVTAKTLNKNTTKWFSGDYGFVLKNIIPLKKPVPAKGALSFWTIRGKTLEKVLKELSPTQRKKILGNSLRKKDS